MPWLPLFDLMFGESKEEGSFFFLSKTKKIILKEEKIQEKEKKTREG